MLTIVWEIFFTLTEFNLWTNFIRIIWLDNLLMLFKATSVYHFFQPLFPSAIFSSHFFHRPFFPDPLFYETNQSMALKISQV